MADMESAKEKLERAIERLESAVGSVAERQTEGPNLADVQQERSRGASELSTLRAEHEELGRRYSVSQEDNAALEQAVNRVSERLDATIGRLRSVLEG